MFMQKYAENSLRSIVEYEIRFLEVYMKCHKNIPTNNNII